MPIGRVWRERSGPLAGVRIADFSWVIVGALATRILADFGAEVVKIEDRTRLDLTRRTPIYKGGSALSTGEEEAAPDPDRSGLFNDLNRNKLSVTLDLQRPEGRELAWQLIAESSVVAENFAPGVMEAWGFTNDRIVSVRPDVIYSRMSGYGHAGPHQSFRSYGPVVQAVSGLSFLGGLPGNAPSGWGLSYMDLQGAYFAAIAMLSAIFARDRTGEGTEIDVACVEVAVNLLGPVLLDAAAHDRSREDLPPGNRLEYADATPHGVYPCLGEDRWIAIAVLDDGEWSALVEAVGAGPLTDPRFAAAVDRVRARAQIDRDLAEWTRHQDGATLAERLQRRGVRAALVHNPRDLFEHNPQLQHRGVLVGSDHPVIGRAPLQDFPVRGSSLAADHWRSAPRLGEDDEHVFRHVLGVDEDRYRELVASGAI